MAPLVQTSVDVIERWPPAKTLAYFEAAMKIQEMKNGGPPGDTGRPNEVMDALGNILDE